MKKYQTVKNPPNICLRKINNFFKKNNNKNQIVMRKKNFFKFKILNISFQLKKI
jgi:hypothetical protein